MRQRLVQLFGGPAHGRLRLDLLDGAPIPITISLPDEHNATAAVYEYVGGNIFLYIGEEVTPGMDRGEPTW